MQKDDQSRHQQPPPHHLFSSSSSSSFASCRRYPLPNVSLDPLSDSTTTDFGPPFDLDSSSESSIRHPLVTPSCRLVSMPSFACPPPDLVERSPGAIVEKRIYTTTQDVAVQSKWAEEIKGDERAGIPSSRALNVQKQEWAELALIRSPRRGYSKNAGSEGLPTKKTNFTGHRKPTDAAEAMVESDSARNQARKLLPARAPAMPDTPSVTCSENSWANSAKASSREHESLLVSGGRITPVNVMKRSLVHQSNAKAPAHFDNLNRYVAENQTSGDYKVMQFTSLQDGWIESPSPPTSSSSKQFLTRSPRSPDPLLSYDSVKTIHSVKTTSSKWDDAEKWLSSPPNQPNIATISCANGQGCGGFAVHTLRMLGKSSNPASLSGAAPEQQQYVGLAEPYQNKLSSRQQASHGVHANPQALQPRSNRRAKHRNSAPSPPQGHTEMQRSLEKEHLESTDHRTGSATLPCTGTPNSESIQHSHQAARMLPPNDPAVASDTAILIDRTQRGCPSPVPVLERKTPCQNSAHRCAECGSTFSDVANTDGFLAVGQNKLASGRELAIMDDAVQPRSPFKERLVVSVMLKDAGTQMTPVDSSSNTTRYSSKCPSPARHNTPARTSRSTSLVTRNSGLDLVELARCHHAKLELQGLSEGERIHSFHRTHSNWSNWSSREAEEEQIGKSLRQLELEDRCTDSAAAEPASRKDEQCKSVARLKREEIRIQAWENHKKAEADAQLSKLEAKLEKRRAQTTEKIMSKLVAAQRQAQQMRTHIRAQQTGFKGPKAPSQFLQMRLRACFTSTLHYP